MTKITKRVAGLALSLLLSATLLACGNGNGNSSASASQSISSVADVASIAMKTNPIKTDYYVGETFDPTGGVVTVTYADGHTEDILLTDSRLELTAPSTETAGKKNGIVKYGGKRCTFTINVTVESFVVTFDLNYEGSIPFIVNADKGSTITKPEDPTRVDYSFDGWYTDSATTSAFDFSSVIVKDMTLYAKWLDASKATFSFTFDLNYYGVAPKTIVQTVEQGKTATKIANPTRFGYDFVAWCDNVDLASPFDFTKTIEIATTVYAKWSRNSVNSASFTYVFEAEDVDLTGKTGNGLSGTVTEKGMIITNDKVGASNDKFIGYLYKPGLSLMFRLASDVDVNVTLAVRFSEEIEDYTYNKSNYTISVNGSDLDYPDIVFSNVPSQTASVPYSQFADFTVASSLPLKAGKNFVSLTTSNMDSIKGTTMEAHAPLIDCIKITAVNAILNWDANYGLPAKNY